MACLRVRRYLVLKGVSASSLQRYAWICVIMPVHLTVLACCNQDHKWPVGFKRKREEIKVGRREEEMYVCVSHKYPFDYS